MNNAKTLTTAGLLVLAGAGLVILIGCVGSAPALADEGDHAMAATAGDDAEGDVTTYVCPMHPDEISDDPEAACSICGMRLEPVEEEEDGDDDHHNHGHHM